MLEITTYNIDNKTYEVHIQRKRMKNIRYSFKDGVFYISAPRIALKRTIMSGLDKFAPKLIKRDTRTQAMTDEYIFVFGEKYPINNINIDNTVIDGSDGAKLQKELSKLLLDYVAERVEFFSKEMDISDAYKVKVRDTKTRLGSNSRRTKTIAFAYGLIHYSKEIIDSVVVHELAHCKVFNHSKEFYNVVYQHCPNYNILRKKLIHSEFK